MKSTQLRAVPRVDLAKAQADHRRPTAAQAESALKATEEEIFELQGALADDKKVHPASELAQHLRRCLGIVRREGEALRWEARAARFHEAVARVREAVLRDIRSAEQALAAAESERDAAALARSEPRKKLAELRAQRATLAAKKGAGRDEARSRLKRAVSAGDTDGALAAATAVDKVDRDEQLIDGQLRPLDVLIEAFEADEARAALAFGKVLERVAVARNALLCMQCDLQALELDTMQFNGLEAQLRFRGLLEAGILDADGRAVRGPEYGAYFIGASKRLAESLGQPKERTLIGAVQIAELVRARRPLSADEALLLAIDQTTLSPAFCAAPPLDAVVAVAAA